MATDRPEIVVVAEDATMSGGAERVALSSARELVGREYPVSLFTAGRTLDPTLHAELFREVVLLDRAPYWEEWFPASKPAKLRTLLTQPEPGKTFAEFLGRRDPRRTLVHFHGFHTRLTHGVVAAALDGGFPTLVTMHDYGLTCPNATQYDYVEGAVCPRRPLSRACWGASCIHSEAMMLKRLRAARTLGQRTVLGINRRIRHLATVSRFAARVNAASLPSQAKIHLVLNPIEATFAPPANPERASAVLWAGRMTAEKDPVLAASAAGMADMPIGFVGSGDLEEAVHAANPQATMLGWRSAAEVGELTSAARALVLTSRWYETASLVTLDAMARGIPPVVPSDTAATEWFDDGIEGLVFERGSATSLARALERLRDDAEVARLGRAAHTRFWADPPTMDAHLDRLDTVYAEVRA